MNWMYQLPRTLMTFFLTCGSVLGSPARTLMRSRRRSLAKVAAGGGVAPVSEDAEDPAERGRRVYALWNRGPQFSTRALRMVSERSCPWILLYLSWTE